MAKRLYCSDIEGDDLLEGITKVWCMSNTELDNKMNTVRLFTITSYDKIKEMFSDPDNILVMHNGVSYDGPAVTKVMGVEVKAEIIDTLFLSWYLYPKMLKHGLAAWGEEFGISKPVVDDWENLSLETYIHRCEEDSKIQTMLWKKIWKDLMRLYGTVEGCWHAVRHLNFKAKQAAMQEKAKWKLDVEGCTELDRVFAEKVEVAFTALEKNMPKVPVWTTKTRPKKPFKANGEISATGQKWIDIVEKYIDPEDYDFIDPIEYTKDVTYISSYKEPNAGSSVQLKAWLDDIGWVPESFKYVRDKETNKVRKIPQIKNQDTEELCESIVRLIPIEPALEYLQELSVVKHRGTITSGFLKAVDSEGYVQALIQGLTNTLRFKHKVCLNLPSLRKPYGKEIRGLLIARDEDSELCGSDMSSLEDRTKQHYMWDFDPEYVKEMMEPGFDPHCDMAIAADLMSKEEAKWFKEYDKDADNSLEDKKEYLRLSLIRHGGKSTNYAATYGATGPTIARSAGVPEAMGDTLHAAYWKRNWSLTAIADSCIAKKALGVSWLWNPIARMWIYLKNEKDRFSTLNQSTGTYCFDRWLFYIIEKRPQLTAQFHDEGVFELAKGHRDSMTKILKDAVVSVNKELKLNRDLGCDVDFGRSYAGIH